MNKWGMRLVLIVMLLIFLMVFMQLYRQLVALQRMQEADPQTTTSTTT